MSDKQEKFIRCIRTVAVIVAGGTGAAFLSLLTVVLLQVSIAKGEDTTNLTALLFGCLVIGGILIGLFCLMIFHAFSFRRSTSLKKVIRLVEAMHMLGAQTHKERLEVIRHHSLRIFRTKTELPPDVSEDIQCKEVSTFLSPMFYNMDRVNSLGSPFYCCDFDQIQQIITDLRDKWGSSRERLEDFSAEIISLERKAADLNEKYQRRTKEYTAATGREGILKAQLAEVKNHIAVLVELANKVSREIKPPYRITESAIKDQYLAIGKIYGITEVPDAYVKIFRKNMPKEIINWGGAPKQGFIDEET